MKHIDLNEMETVQGGYCDPVIYAATGICTNPGCLVAAVWNSVTVSVTVTVGGETISYEKDPMYCAL